MVLQRVLEGRGAYQSTYLAGPMEVVEESSLKIALTMVVGFI